MEKIKTKLNRKKEERQSKMQTENLNRRPDPVDCTVGNVNTLNLKVNIKSLKRILTIGRNAIKSNTATLQYAVQPTNNHQSTHPHQQGRRTEFNGIRIIDSHWLVNVLGRIKCKKIKRNRGNCNKCNFLSGYVCTLYVSY